MAVRANQARRSLRRRVNWPTSAEMQSIEKAAQRAQERLTIRQAAIAKVKPEYESIERRIAELAAKAIAANDAINQLNAKCAAELQEVNVEYNQAVSNSAVSKRSEFRNRPCV